MKLYESETSKIVDLMQNEDPFFNYLTNKIISYIDKTKKGRILDLGCGGGRNAVVSAKQGYKVVAVDYVEKSIDIAQELAKKNNVEKQISFYCRDITKLKKNEFGKFDYIILQEVIEHIKDYQSVIDFSYESLNKNGKILITTPHDPGQWNKLDEYARHERRFLISQVKKSLTKFKTSTVHTLGFPFHRSVLTLYSLMLTSIKKEHKAKFFRKNKFIHRLYYFLGSLVLYER